jgi:RHS repeat-associated protein
LGNPDIANNYLHQGRWYSWQTGLYYHRARWRDPETGRWLSKDPIGINGGLNQYVVFDNNSVMFRDADGLDATFAQDFFYSNPFARPETISGGITVIIVKAKASIVAASGMAAVPATAGAAIGSSIGYGVNWFNENVTGISLGSAIYELIHGRPGSRQLWSPPVAMSRGARDRGRTARPDGTPRPDKHARPIKGDPKGRYEVRDQHGKKRKKSPGWKPGAAFMLWDIYPDQDMTSDDIFEKRTMPCE